MAEDSCEWLSLWYDACYNKIEAMEAKILSHCVFLQEKIPRKHTAVLSCVSPNLDLGRGGLAAKKS